MPIPSEKEVHGLIDHLFRQEYGKVVCYLTSIFGISRLPEMEDMAQEALLEAYKNWSYHGIPPQPDRWIFKVAKNKAINLLVRERKRSKVYEMFEESREPSSEKDLYIEKEIEDSVLRMIFACATLKLSSINIILLVLNTLCGFTRKEIAQAMLMEEETVKKRLFRAKREIRHNDWSFVAPKGKALNSAFDSVLTCLYLLFNEGYNSSHKDDLIRKDLCLEAIRLTKIVANYFDKKTEANALLALMCFHTARFASRIDDKGAIILIENQDRDMWDRDLIHIGVYYLSKASTGNVLSAYHLEAAIASEHCMAASFVDTRWNRIYNLYVQLLEVKPSPVIELNMAIVTSQLGKVDFAIEKLEGLEKKYKQLSKYYLLHATLGELYGRQGKLAVARHKFMKSRTLTSSQKELDLLDKKIADLET